MGKIDFMQQWINIMDPEKLKPNLELISLYITMYEMLEDMIIERPRDFFTVIDTVDDEEYKAEVLSLYAPERCPLIRKGSRVLIASLLWWRKMDAITDDDIDSFSRCKMTRNTLTHEMMSSLSKGLDDGFYDDFFKMYNLFCKMERWWILEIEVSINPDYDDMDMEQLKSADVHSGNMIILSMIIDIVTSGSDKYLDEACKRFGIARSRNKCDSDA